MAKRVARRLPVKLGIMMGLAALFRPKTRGWGKARAAITEYVDEQGAKHRKALGLAELVEEAKRELTAVGAKPH
jgi:heterodisulfide reductase subunit C